MQVNVKAWLAYGLALLAAPLLLGLINRTKAFFAGRRGRPLLQVYYDLAKLMRKGAVFSRTTTWVFRLGPAASLAALLLALTLVPLPGLGAPLSFSGDLILFAYLLGLARFCTVAAALDTGSSFEGMGASREVWLAILAEPAFFISLAVACRETHQLSLSGMFAALAARPMTGFSGAAMFMAGLAIFALALAENARLPVDDPDTHLELTMIHEVLVLDHSGPDFGFITYAAALKLWAWLMLLSGMLLPAAAGARPLAVLAGWGCLAGLAVAVGVVESCMARLRLVRVPQLLAGACALSALALMLALR